MHIPNGIQLAKWSGSIQSKYISHVTSAYCEEHGKMYNPKWQTTLLMVPGIQYNKYPAESYLKHYKGQLCKYETPDPITSQIVTHHET